jgi:hypothetical protein
VSRAAARALLLAGALAAPAGAVELDRGDLRLELTNHDRLLFTSSRELYLDDFLDGSQTRKPSWLLTGRMRLDLEAAWRDQLFGQLVYDLEGRTGPGLDTLRFALSDAIGTRTAIDLDRTFSERADFNGRHLIYRGWLRWEEERWDLTVGRQRIPLGRTRLWNPTDLFNPIFPLAIQGDQRIGQDGARARVKLADRVWGEAMITRQSDPWITKSAVRIETLQPQLDGALMVGLFGEDYVFGADFARNLGEAALRGEATWTAADDRDDFLQAVLSLDYTFSIGNGLYGLVEHLYNENLVPDLIPPSLLAGAGAVIQAIAVQQSILLDRITTLDRNQTAIALGYELTPLVRADLLTIYDWSGTSTAIFPVLGVSLSDDLQLSLGAQFFVGASGSEYGDLTTLVFVQLDAYF